MSTKKTIPIAAPIIQNCVIVCGYPEKDTAEEMDVRARVITIADYPGHRFFIRKCGISGKYKASEYRTGLSIMGPATGNPGADSMKEAISIAKNWININGGLRGLSKRVKEMVKVWGEVNR